MRLGSRSRGEWAFCAFQGIAAQSKKHAEANVRVFEKLIDGNTPLIGLEPSAILSFRDEYPRIVGPEWVESAKKLKFHVQLIDEFLGKEVAAGNIKPEEFTTRAEKSNCTDTAIKRHFLRFLGLKNPLPSY